MHTIKLRKIESHTSNQLRIIMQLHFINFTYKKMSCGAGNEHVKT